MIHSSADLSDFEFQSQGETLRGVVHIPRRSNNTALLLIHGWGTCRLGPERSFVFFSRLCADAGYTVFRYDLPGRGESGGEYSSVTVDDMASSVKDCVSYIREEFPELSSVGLGGICSGANTAVLASAESDISFLILWSMFPFKTSAPVGVKTRKTGSALGIYIKKLFLPQTWRKIVTGSLNIRKIMNVLFGHYTKDRTDLQETGVPVMDKFSTLKVPVLFVYGEKDPEGEYSLKHYRRFTEEHSLNAQFHIINSASHNFYRKEWQDELFSVTLSFLSGLKGTP